MDERRTLPLQPGVTPGAPPPATALWRQLLAALGVLLIAAAIWFALRPADFQPLLAWAGIGATVSEGGSEQQAQQPGPQPRGQQAGQGQQQAQAQPQGQQAQGQGNVLPGGGNFAAGGQGRNRAAVVVTAPVTAATVNDRLTAIGEGTAFRSATVASTAGGMLTALLASPGDRVEAGAVIGQLDDEAEQIALDRATLAAQDTQRALARAQELAQSQSVSAVQLSAAKLAADQAALELRNAQLAFDRRRITSPIAGTVGLLQVTPGNQVNAQTPVTTIEDSSEILVNFWVPERYASTIATGMPVSAVAVALPGLAFSGAVSAVDNRIDPASRTLQVQALLPNADGRIRPGMSFEVTMNFPGESFPAVDPLAIQWSTEGAFVWKYADGRVQQAKVQIVERNSGGVLVTGDIAAGDAVVTQGVLQLQQGQSVCLLDQPCVGGTGPGAGRGQGEQPQESHGG